MGLRTRLLQWANNDGQGKKALEKYVLPGMLLLSLVTFFFVGSVLDDRNGFVQEWMAWAADNPLAIIVVIAVFVSFGMLGTPQFLLFTVTGAVLPPVQAFIYSWVATMLSATIHFYMGSHFQEVIRASSGRRLTKLKAIIANNGVLASALVRNVPAGPFIFVNVVCGASGMKNTHFWAGTAFGIIPKAAASIFLGINLGEFLKNPTLENLGILAAVILAVVLVSIGVTRIFQQLETEPKADIDSQ